MSENNTKYNLSQLMVTAAAREIADGEVVFVGMRLPLLGFLLAKNTHAPDAVGVYELGIVRGTAAAEPLMTMGDLPNLCRAQWLADTADTMGLLQQGGVDVQYPPRVMLHEPRAEDANEAGEYEQVGLDLVESRGDRAIEGFAVVEAAVLNTRGRDARVAGTLQPEGIGSVAEDQAQVEISVAGRRRIDECLQVSAGSRDQDDCLAIAQE